MSRWPVFLPKFLGHFFDQVGNCLHRGRPRHQFFFLTHSLSPFAHLRPSRWPCLCLSLYSTLAVKWIQRPDTCYVCMALDLSNPILLFPSHPPWQDTPCCLRAGNVLDAKPWPGVFVENYPGTKDIREVSYSQMSPKAIASTHIYRW